MNDVDLGKFIIKQSKQFETDTNVAFPTANNRVDTLLHRKRITHEQIGQHARSVRINCLRSVVDASRKLPVTAGASRQAFLVRCVRDRPLVFYTRHDIAVLRNGTAVSGGFEDIGTDDEKAPLLSKDYISYKEMLFSALVTVSSYVTFINDMNRDNAGHTGESGSFEQEGLLIGAVGARCEKPDQMESLFIIVDKSRSTVANGYGEAGAQKGRYRDVLAVMEHLYALPYFPTFDEASAEHSSGQSTRYELLKTGNFLDTLAYRKRISITLTTILCDAEARGAEAGKQVWLNQCGLGLGAWAVKRSVQEPLFVTELQQAIQSLSLPHIDDVCLIHFDASAHRAPMVDGGTVRDRSGRRITVHFGGANANPASPLKDKKLLVAVFAWDGNSFPGNEYWRGQLTASGDPAAASACTLPEIQNPMINPCLVDGNCVRIFETPQ